MPLALVNDKSIYFAHIPKCGGTSVESYLRTKGRLVLCTKEPNAWSRTTPQHMTADVAATYVPVTSTDHRFTIIRDPFNRFLSEFRMKARNLSPQQRTALSKGSMVGAVTKAVFGPRGNLRNLFAFGSTENPRFMTFDQWVGRALKRIRHNPTTSDGHFVPQHAYLEKDIKVFRFEDGLDPVFDWIDDITGTDRSERGHAKKGERLEFSISQKIFKRIMDHLKTEYAALASFGYTAPRAQDVCVPAPSTANGAV